MGYQGNILLSAEGTNGREEGQREKPHLCREGGGETKTESLNLWLLVLGLLAGGRWLREAQSLI